MKHECYRVLDTPLPAHVPVKPGDYVYKAQGYDYGVASDDSEVSGEKYVSVSADKHGAIPYFTIPQRALGAAEPVEAVYPDDAYVKAICRAGEGEVCCRYLTVGAGGWSCEKHALLASIIDYKVERGEIGAKGDNCEGLYSR